VKALKTIKPSKLLPVLDSIRLLDLLVKLRSRNVLVIIMYHGVGDKMTYYDISLPIELFERHIRYLIKMKFKIMPLCEALESIICGNPPSRIAVLTFDDGYSGVYIHAFPIMKKYGVRGTIYVSAGLIEHRVPHWASQIGYIFSRITHTCLPIQIDLGEAGILRIHNEGERKLRLSEVLMKIQRMNVNEIRALIKKLSSALGVSIPSDLYEEIMLTSDQLREMSEYGMEIGGHGYWHVALPNLNSDEVAHEVAESLMFIDKFNVNCNLKTFAYPYGLYSDAVIDVLQKAGFNAAVTMEPKLNDMRHFDLYKLSRIPPYRFGIIGLSTLKYQLIKSGN